MRKQNKKKNSENKILRAKLTRGRVYRQPVMEKKIANERFTKFAYLIAFE
jgi:hypothetical protein